MEDFAPPTLDDRGDDGIGGEPIRSGPRSTAVRLVQHLPDEGDGIFDLAPALLRAREYVAGIADRDGRKPLRIERRRKVTARIAIDAARPCGWADHT